MEDHELQSILERVLELRESGRTEAQILAEFSLQTEEIRGFLRMISRLEEQRQTEPRSELLKQIFAKMPAVEPRPLSSSNLPKGRTSFISLLSDQIHNHMGLKLSLIGIALIAVIAVIFMRMGPQTGIISPPAGQTQPTGGQTANNSQPIAPATGNPDDAANAIIAGGTNEQASVNVEDSDSSAVGAETLSMGEFDAVYNANEF